MDLQGYKVKNTTKCECGHEFTIHDMKTLKRISDNRFYGGVIKHVDEIKCPECQKETLLLLKQVGQTYIVKDIAQKDTKSDKENEKNTIIEEEKEEMVSEAIMIENKEENTSSNEIICPKCKRGFKNKSGLINHMKVHNK